jgi:PHP family Zn ribbon phosphoesterase/tetratricopeptide (TPR) repeat protein
MEFIADLHVHSRFSRACSPRLRLEALHAECQVKGVGVAGTGDFTHPEWLSELEAKLVFDADGLWRLSPPLAAEADSGVPESCRAPVRFLIQGEVSCIYRMGGKVRKVHHLLFAPSFEAARKARAALEKAGDLGSDGRPILRLDSRRLLSMILDLDAGVHLVPAHAWTPHFSVFGSKSGFDSLEECFGDLAGEVFAVETGLSSDPPMNWRVSALDRLSLISASDAHSPENVAREACIFEGEPSYSGIFGALRRRGPSRLVKTIEFFPEEGKYHADGHRACAVRLDCSETRRLGGLCPVCGKTVTVGVLGRVEALADRGLPRRPEGAAGFERVVPLREVLSEVLGVGPLSAAVRRERRGLIERFGSELFILRRLPLGKLDALLARALGRMRSGRVDVRAGFDGEYGKVSLLRKRDFVRPAALAALLCALPAAGAGASEGPREVFEPPAARAREPAKPGRESREAGRAVEDFLGSRDFKSLEKSMAYLKDLAQSPQGREFFRFFKGVRWRGEGEPPEDAVIAEMMRSFPEDASGFRLMALLRAGRNDPLGTIEYSEKALRLGGPDPEMFVLRGNAFSELGRFQPAHDDAAEALRLDPNDPAALALFKLTESRIRRLRLPRVVGKESESEDPETGWTPGSPREASPPDAGLSERAAKSAALSREAAGALRLSDAWSALRKASAALDLNPLNAQAYNLRAMAEVRLSRHAAAVEDASRALEISPGSPAALATRAWARGRMRDWSAALRDASAAVESNPSDPAARLTRAFALAGLGRREEMLSELREAGALYPAFKPLRERAAALPAGADPMLLFAGLEPGGGPAQAPVGRGSKPLVIVLASLTGGFLIALGLLQNVAGIRDRVSGRLRRLRPAATPEGGSFWKRYSRVREIGSGGMGVVYEAVDLGLRRKVAVKRMKEDLASQESGRMRFVDEARIAASLKHPNAAEIYSIEEDAGDIYLVFEFVEGRTLERVLKDRRRIEPSEAAGIFQGVCSALEAAHARGIVHRDLKPANIMVQPDGKAKVMDFGLARRQGSERRTSVGSAWGSPAYMAPEAEEGEALAQSDVYSLGICLYESLTGELPFPGSPASALLKKREGVFPPASRLRPGLPAGVDDLIARSLRPAPADRLRSAGEFSSLLSLLS